MTTLDIAQTDKATLVAAHAQGGVDFEDDLHIASEIQAGVNAIVSRDPRGFAASPIPVMDPRDVVALLPTPTSP